MAVWVAQAQDRPRRFVARMTTADMPSILVSELVGHAKRRRRARLFKVLDRELSVELVPYPGWHNTFATTTTRRGPDGTVSRATDIRVMWTEPNYGGLRPWFLCPGCRRYCDRLYVDELELKCRKCARLLYASQSMRPAETRIAKIIKIHERLGDPKAEFRTPPRPSGMHRTTYTRLLDELRALEEEAFAQAADRASAHMAALLEQIARLEDT